MKTTLKDWFITALAYIIIGTLLYAVNHDDDSNPGTDTPQAHASSVQTTHRVKHTQTTGAAPASSASLAMVAMVAATPVIPPASSAAASSNSFMRDSKDQASLQQLTQEASQMTGITASPQ